MKTLISRMKKKLRWRFQDGTKKNVKKKREMKNRSHRVWKERKRVKDERKIINRGTRFCFRVNRIEKKNSMSVSIFLHFVRCLCCFVKKENSSSWFHTRKLSKNDVRHVTQLLLYQPMISFPIITHVFRGKYNFEKLFTRRRMVRASCVSIWYFASSFFLLLLWMCKKKKKWNIFLLKDERNYEVKYWRVIEGNWWEDKKRERERANIISY